MWRQFETDENWNTRDIICEHCQSSNLLLHEWGDNYTVYECEDCGLFTITGDITEEELENYN